jgi:hypothetical protein
MIRAIKGGARGAKAAHVLSKTYSLILDSYNEERLKATASAFSEFYNEFEIAAKILGEFAASIDASHPKAEREIKKYIMMSKRPSWPWHDQR